MVTSIDMKQFIPHSIPQCASGMALRSLHIFTRHIINKPTLILLYV